MKIEIFLVEKVPWDVAFFESVLDVATDAFMDNLRQYMILFLSCDLDSWMFDEVLHKLCHEHAIWVYAQVQEMKEHFDG